MAKKAKKQNGKVNKSQAIRDALAKSADGSPKQVVTDLAAQGINVSPAFVSIIKGKMNAKGKKTRKSRGTATQNVAPKQNGDTVVTSDLVEAKRLVDKVGGIENAELCRSKVGGDWDGGPIGIRPVDNEAKWAHEFTTRQSHIAASLLRRSQQGIHEMWLDTADVPRENGSDSAQLCSPEPDFDPQ